MFRSISAAALLAALALASTPVLAADYDQFCCGAGGGDGGDNGFGDMRSGYPVDPGDWAGLGDKDDPLRFEFGARYWYSMGSQSLSTTAGAFNTTDTSHVVEGHLRIEDHSTNVFAKAIGGYAVKLGGTYDDPFGGGSVVDGHLGYLGADIGYSPWGDNHGSGFGPLVGYMYWNNSPNTSRANYTTATSSEDIGFDQNTGETFVPGDSKPNNLDVHMLRLGVQGKADMGMFDITAEAVAVPYAKVTGIVGNDQTSTTYDFSVYPGGNVHSIKASPTTLDGWGYGGMTDVMIGFHPTENMAIRVGGRAWYLQGVANAYYDQATIGNPSDSDPDHPPNFDTPPSFGKQTFVEQQNPFSMLRYGLLTELTYSF